MVKRKTKTKTKPLTKKELLASTRLLGRVGTGSTPTRTIQPRRGYAY